MSLCQGSRFEQLERRCLLAVRTVDFDNYPLNFTQYDWMLQSSHTPSSGFSYTIGTGDGQRPNVNGITWPDASYYDTVLGSGGFTAVNNWNMKPVVLYTQAKSGGWLTQGWNYVPDMAEGAAAVDDAGRAAVTYADDYLLNGTASSYQTARDILTFVAYMTTRQGKVYNFAWLDAPATFGWDPIYSQDKHFEYRSEYVKRTAYPSASPDNSWFDQNSDPAHIINWPNPVRANPFISHPKFSVYIDDLRDASNNDVAKVYDGPLYSTAGGGPTSFKTGIKKTWTNSTQAFGADDGRALMALAKGLMMMQKREAETGGLNADDLNFARFLENNMNRMVRNVLSQNFSGWDSKLASMVLPALADYYQLYYGSDAYGTYAFKLASDSNTAETTDDRPVQATVLSAINQLATLIESRQVRTADWKNGIFSDDGTGNNWDAWGQLQIYALSRTYRMEVNTGQNPASPSVSSQLDYAAYAADNFYGIEAYHYLAPGTNNVRTKERITSIVGGAAKYHTNSTQIAYHNSSLVADLRELTLAYEVSDRADKATRMATYLNGIKSVASWFIGNNTSLLDMYDGGGTLTGTFRGRGAVFDGITPNGSQIPSINRNTGGESFAEGLWAIVLAKAAIRDYSISPTFAFETGASAAAAPVVSSSVFDYNAPQPTVRFVFNQDVGASLHAYDISVVNTQSSQVVPTQFMSLGYNAALRQLSITFPGYPGGVLPDGDYHVTILSSGVVGNSGNPMAADYPFDFFALGGDANRDRSVDSTDLGIVATNWQQTGRTFSQGDFNYSGTVDVNDLSILATNWQKVLVLPTGARRALRSLPRPLVNHFCSSCLNKARKSHQQIDRGIRPGVADFKERKMTKRNRNHQIHTSGFVVGRAARRALAYASCACATAAGLNSARIAMATDISWTGTPATPLNFGTGTNWVGGAVPDSPDNAFINNGGIATVPAAFTRTVTDLQLGSAAATSGGLAVSGGSINATGNMTFGGNATGSGTLNISDGALNIGAGLLGNFSIGDDGAGTATISGGVITTRFAFLGKSTHGSGHVTQTGGGLVAQRNFVMAELKPADLAAVQTPSDYTMSAGSITVGEEMYIGAHGPATFNLSGTGSISVVGTLHIAASGGLSDAPAGVGTLNMSGGTISVTGANGYFVVADHGNATFNFSGGTLNTKLYRIGENFELGFPTVGIVNHTGGTATAEFDWIIGNESRSENLYDLSGGSVTVLGLTGDPFNPGNVSIGSGPGGRGTLMVRGTGVANVANSAILGGATFSSGTIIVSSGGSLALGTNGLGTAQMTVGSNGTGNFQISGGNVSTDLITLGQNTSAVGTGTQTGGTVVARSNVSIGETSLANNVYDITGGTMSVGGGIYIGSTGNGTLKVGGTATVTSALTIENAPSGGGTIEVSGGNLTAPSMNSLGLYTQSGGHASLGDVTGSGQISVSGGSLSVTSIAQGTLGISSTGSVTVSPHGVVAGINVVNSFSVTTGGKLNLTNNSMVIDYTGPVGTQVSDIRNDLRTGRLTSSSATATTRLGYGDNAVLGKTTFAGQAVDSSSILIKYTYAGDADLDGDADGVDIGTWATNFTGELGGAGSSVWTQGDWDYDGDVDGVDAGLWAQAFTGELGGGGLGALVVNDPNLTPQAVAILRGLGITVVPEPATPVLLGLAGLMVWRRHRARRNPICH